MYIAVEDIHAKELDDIIGEEPAEELREELEMVEGVYDAFDREPICLEMSRQYFLVLR